MRRNIVWIILLTALFVLAWLCLFTGSVNIPYSDTWNVLTGGVAQKKTWTRIILELRLPMAATAALTGAALGVAGLLLQTVFNNPLAGPSILGISTGASLGAAVVLLALPGIADPQGASVVGAFAGSACVLLLLLGFSVLVRSAIMLLIVGIMLGYITSSVISVLNFYSTQEGVHSYVIWGMGNFSGVGRAGLTLYSTLILTMLAMSLLLVKPLNAMLLGERHAANVGINVQVSRLGVLAITGVLIAITTAFCGPIGFIGLAVPHIARLLLRTSNHKSLIPAVILTGAATGLLTLWLTTLPGERGMLPVNAITPVIGVPVVLYIILNKKMKNK